MDCTHELPTVNADVKNLQAELQRLCERATTVTTQPCDEVSERQAACLVIRGK